MRLDQKLVEIGLCPSRTKAKEVIERGEVLVNGLVIKKPSFSLEGNEKIEVIESEILKFVSRAGAKLEAALLSLEIDVSGKRIFDVGQSTGGFTDVVLQLGAEKVVGIDVGHDQLSARLKENERVISFEGINIKTIDERPELSSYHAWADIVVADLSFISLSSVFEKVLWPLRSGGELVLLVKPQFQLSKAEIGAGGIVKDSASYLKVERDLIETAKKWGIVSTQWLKSDLKGRDGNQEFFLYGKKQ